MAALAIGLSRAIATSDVTAGVIVIVVLGTPSLASARALFRRAPAIIIDREGIDGFRARRRVPWSAISDMHVSQRQGVFGTYHHLVLTVRRDDQPPAQDALGLLTSRVPIETVEFSLDQLAKPWKEIVSVVEEGFGRSVTINRSAGFRSFKR